MKTQAPHIVFLTLALLMAATPALADCLLVRMYRDEKRIMHHFSTQTLAAGKNDNVLCTSACRKEAEYMPSIDAVQLRNNTQVKEVLLRCSYTAGRNASPESSKVLAESTLPITRLKVRKESAPLRPNASPYAISPRASAAISRMSSQNSAITSSDTKDAPSDNAQQKQNYDLSPRYQQNREKSAVSPYARPTPPAGMIRQQ
jgi:hypothetical protein